MRESLCEAFSPSNLRLVLRGKHVGKRFHPEVVVSTLRNSQANLLDRLPVEILLQILSYLPISDLFLLKLAGSRHISVIINSLPHLPFEDYVQDLHDEAVLRKDQRWVLEIAADRGHEALVRTLLERIPQLDSTKRSALLYAAGRGHDATVNLLLKRVNKSWHRMALHRAATNGQEATVKLLLKKRAKVKWATKKGWTALHLASENGHEAVVRILIHHGAKMKAATVEGWTALQLASRNGHEAVVRLLIDRGAQMKAATKYGVTSLHVAARGGHEAVVKFLVEQGADLQAQTWPRRSALHLAVYRGWIEVVKTLLSLGADPLSPDLYGRTSLDWAFLHKPTFDIISPYCGDSSLTDQVIYSRVLRKSIVTIAAGLRADQHAPLYQDLGHCLLLVNNVQDAKTAFEQEIDETSGRLNSRHIVQCDMCLSGNISGKRFVCRVCGDIDLCSACMEKYKTGVSVRTCESHSFLSIPGDDWQDLRHPDVNKLGESMDQWLERLRRFYLFPL